MQTSNFKTINRISGGLIFLIAASVYIVTLEPTASFWDCAEFISCSYKLEIPHPPGAPLFLLIGRMFSLFAGNDVYKVAYFINMVSALASAATIAFLYWTIVLIAKKISPFPSDKATFWQLFLVIGSGITGALTFTFSDTFWFSAVEGEVYALSSLFIAIVLWVMLKWESLADDPYSDKYLLLIAYIIGLSIGVHLLCLLAIPSLCLVYYFKKYSYTHKGFLIAFAIGFGILEFIQIGIIEGLPTLAGKMEVFFVNNLHLPFGSGIITFFLVFFFIIIYSIYYSVKAKKRILNTVILCFVFLLIGFGSYSIILIRSAYNPPIDQNDPENMLNFLFYIKRQQYEQRPIFYGPNYTAELISQTEEEPIYEKGKTKYEIIDHKLQNIFDPKHCTIFPRMTSKSPGHPKLYAQWTNKPEGKKPTLMDNISFFLKYQIGHMYFRYLMWNFSGREGYLQDSGWLRPWDNFAHVPDSIMENKYRNNFFMLPFILGLIGIIFLYKKDRSHFIVTAMLFLLTGILLVIYQNSPPSEPRERDYIYVGSYYVFSIWIGLGLAELAGMITKILSDKKSALIAFIICISIPFLMAKEGWDDHNRSMRVHSAEFARNILNSCEDNAILFTGGDNDTFMLWYIQEVEGFRKDVRVCNLNLLNMEYYINGMKRNSYQSAPLPISFDQYQYRRGKNEYIPYVQNPNGENGILLPVYLDLIKKQDPAITVQTHNGSVLPVLPSSTLLLPIDIALTKKYFPGNHPFEALLKWNIGKNALDKSQLMMLDIIVNNKWQRPIHFFMSLSKENYLGLEDHMQMEGYTYRLLPYKTSNGNEIAVNTHIMYNNVMNKMQWTNLNRPDFNADENYTRMVQTGRNVFLRLAEALYEKGDTLKAKEVINKSLLTITDKAVPYDFMAPQLIALLFELKEKEMAMNITKCLAKKSSDEIDYYYNTKGFDNIEFQTALYILSRLVNILNAEGYENEASPYKKMLEKYAAI